ncbi:MAG TPA: flagellar basal body P-ring protein FlgI [Methylomirabilota bacterium]|nr:flagellar basal body P-ring protein FlgI [Methylomirabilota bacterium]
MARLLFILLLGCTTASSFAVASRIKDLVMISGVRENQLVGYGLVVGLAGDGDKDPLYTIQAVANMLQRFGITVPASTLSSKNVAAVVVTADIRPYMRSGTRLDVTVAAMGDAKSLQGGVLLQTPLLGADGKTYAVAQGALAVGGFSAGSSGGGGANVQKNHPTVAQIAGGAIVEAEIPMQLMQDGRVNFLLREPDFTSAARMAEAINKVYPDLAQAVDPTTVSVKVPPGWEGTPVDFVARVESIEVTPDMAARIIINERTGTIVATSNIKIAACAVAHGELTITIASSLDVSQPAPFSQTGSTTVTPRTDTKVTEANSALIPLPEMPSIEKVAAALNALGVGPRDVMSIFQAMKQAGALQAELILR